MLRGGVTSGATPPHHDHTRSFSKCLYEAFVAAISRIPANVSTGNRDLSGMKASCGAVVGHVNLHPYKILENNFVREESSLGGPVGDGIRKEGGGRERGQINTRRTSKAWERRRTSQESILCVRAEGHVCLGSTRLNWPPK